jgi:hypothetical protein
MAPGRNRFWCPALRLTAFTAAVVVVGNVLLLAAQPPTASDRFSGRSTDFLGRSRKQIEKRLRLFHRFLFGPSEEPVTTAPDGSGAIWLALPELELLVQSEPIADAKIASTGLPVALAASAPEVGLPMVAPFVMPSLPPPPRLPVEVSTMEPWLTPELLTRFDQTTKGGILEDLGDSLLKTPEALLDAMVRCVGTFMGRSGTVTLRDETSVTERIFDVQVSRREGRIFAEFMGNWVDREQHYLARFGDSELLTLGVEDGTEDVNLHDLTREQGKVLWDALKKTYLSKYRFRGEDRVREDAFYIDRWRGADFVAVPALLASYVWFRGLEKKMSVGDTWVRLSVEPLERWVSGKEDMAAGVSLEWGIKGFPVALIVSAGRTGGRTDMDFIGIGTSVGMVRKILTLRGD